MNSYENLLIWILLISTVTFSSTSSCLPGVIGTCGCCDSTRTTCIEVPYNILPFVTPNYMCISNEIIKTFSFTLCNCTLKDPPLCSCFNRTQSLPIYEQCDSYTECAIADIRVKAKHEIYNTLCNRPIRTGRCSYRYMNRFYFDFHYNLCKEFMYSGCSANRKTFLTREFCEHTCQF